jgi:O-acetyl-ADP-ribose deacetylase (regulator of RNase III)
MGGAIGAFIFIWWHGTKSSTKAINIDELQGKLRSLEDELKKLRDTTKIDKELKVLTECQIYNYRVKKLPDKVIGLITGHIQRVKDIDIWVNSENTNMQMARFYEMSISANIRYLGSKKDIVGNVTEDIIADELAKIMGSNYVVQPATVLVTSAGELERTHNVKKIFHVGTAHGEIGFGYRPISNLDHCIINALKKADSDEFRQFRSILFPLIGTGTAKGNLKEIAEKLLRAAISYAESTPGSNIKRIYFLVWSDMQQKICEAILDECKEVGKLEFQDGQCP